jgi:hypothetical protein
MYALYLYFIGLSFRSTANALEPIAEKRSHVAVWNRIQLLNPNKFYLKLTRVAAFIMEVTHVADWFRVCMGMGSYRTCT